MRSSNNHYGCKIATYTIKNLNTGLTYFFVAKTESRIQILPNICFFAKCMISKIFLQTALNPD
jgi:hypothetical protein